MNKEQIFELLKFIKAIYNERFSKLDSDTLSAWLEVLSEFQYEKIRKSAVIYAQSSKYSPTPADLIEIYRGMSAEDKDVKEWQ